MKTVHTTPTSGTTRRRTPVRLSVAALAVAAAVTTGGAALAQTPVRDIVPAAASAEASTSAQAEASTSKGTRERAVPRVVQEWEAAWNSGDGDRMASLFTKHGVYQDFSLDYRFTGRAQIAEFVETSVTNVTGLQVEVTDAFRTNNRVGVRFVFTGHINGAPKPFSVPVFTVMELQGNKIAYDGDYYNRLDVLRQSGLPTN